jgi:hypothetical protein
MTQAVEHLLCNCEALSSNTLSHQKKKKKKKTRKKTPAKSQVTQLKPTINPYLYSSIDIPLLISCPLFP